MTLVMRTAVAALGVTGLLLATALAAASCASHREESRALAEAQSGANQIVRLIADNEIGLARELFLETHEPLHLTATELESVAPEVAEVVNDVTEVLKESFRSKPVNRQVVMDLAEETLVRLDEAHFALDG